MTEPRPGAGAEDPGCAARVSAALLAGAWAGALVGATLAGAESAVGYVAGDTFTLRWPAFLLAYYVPGWALVGAAVAGVVSRATNVVETARRTTIALSGLVTAGFAAVLMTQELLPGRPMRERWPLLALAIAQGAGVAYVIHRATRARPPTVPAALLTVLPVILAFIWSDLMAGTVGGSPIRRITTMASAPLAVSAVVMALAASLRPVAARALALGLAIALASVVAVAHMTYADPSALRREDPQPPPARPGDERPNVVMIVLDAARARSFSCYGYARRTTPNIDAFAASAVRYSNATTTGPWSLPGHSALFTGLIFPASGGSDGLQLALPDSVVTLAELLGQQGYATGGIAANYAVLGRGYGLDQGFRFYDSSKGNYASTSYTPLLHRLEAALPYRLLRFPLADWFRPHRPAEEITSAALDWLEGGRPGGQPYFLFLNYLDVHHPYTSQRSFRDAWGARSNNHKFPANDINGSDYDAIVSGRRTLTADEHQHLTDLNDAALSYLDEAVGRLLRFLGAQPDASHTWIILTADHGDSIGEHGHLGHDLADLYQEVIQVPLIIRRPGEARDRVGRIDARPTSLVDVMPTILEGMGIEPATALEGIPLTRPRQAMFAEAVGGATVIQDGMKYIRRTGGREELYDLAADPLELRALRDRPAEAARLRARLEEWLVTRRTIPTPQAVTLTEEARERLRALGYLR